MDNDSMQFIIMGSTNTENRLSINGECVGDVVSDEIKSVRTIGVALVTNDDFIKDKYGVYFGSGNDSFQIRAKALYKSKNGVFYKFSRNHYLNEKQLQELDNFINYLNNSGWTPEDLDERIKERTRMRGW